MSSQEKGRVLSGLGDFIKNEILDDDEIELENDLPLLQLGIIDSLAIISVIAFIDRAFDVQIPPDDILPQNFETLDAIATLVMTKQTA